MLADSNKQLVRRLYDDLNAGRLDHLEAVISRDYVTPQGTRGPSGFAQTMSVLRAGFPDLVYTIEEILGDGDLVAVRWTWRGTHTGAFRTFAPTGTKVANAGFAIFQIAGGKITRGIIDTDRLGFLLALGAIPYDPAFGPPPAAP